MKYAIIQNNTVINVAVADVPLADNWIASVSANIGDIFKNGEFLKPVTSFDYEKVWEDIKRERDNRVQNGGYLASGKWFHSDTFSRSQQLGLVLMGANIPQGLMWKTMDGSFIEMTQDIANQIFTSAGISDAQTFAYAEALKEQINKASDPFSIDIYSGWPVCFLDA